MGPKKLSSRCFEFSGLTEIVLPASVAFIEDEVFHGCEQLCSVAFAEGSELKRIGFRAFSRTGLVSFTAPPYLEELDMFAF